MTPKRFSYVLAGCLLLAVGLAAACFYFIDGTLKQQSLRAADLLAERDAHEKKLTDLKQQERENIDIAALNELIDGILPTAKKQENLVASVLNNAIKEVGIQPFEITSITFTGTGTPDTLSGATAAKEVSGVYYYPFTISLRGIDYDQFLNLLQEFENNQRIIQVDQVQISPNKTVKNQLDAVTLSLRSYIKP